MPVALAGYLDLTGAMPPEDLRARVLQGLQAQNFGALHADCSVAVEGPMALGRVSIFPQAHDPGPDAATLPPVARSGARMLAGDFRLYGPDSVLVATLRADPPPDCEEALNARTEAHLLADPAWLTPAGADALDGDFAFAHWDGASQRLTLVRDAVGIRPLVWTHVAGTVFAFSTSPAALIAMRVRRFTLSQDYLTRRVHFAMNGETMIEGVRPVPPGTVFRVGRDGHPRETPYWSLKSIGPTRRDLAFEDAAGILQDKIRRATERRLSRFFRTGSHLSSGLDSGLAAVFAARRLTQSGDRLVGLALADDFEHPDHIRHDETRLVNNLVQQEGGIDLVRCPVGDGTEDIVNKKPPFPASDFSRDSENGEGGIARRAAERGTDVILAGHGADEFASGHGFSAAVEMLFTGRWRTLYRTLKEFERTRGWGVGFQLRRTLALHFVPQSILKRMGKTLINRAYLAQEARQFTTPAAWTKSLPYKRGDAAFSERAHREEQWSQGHILYAIDRCNHHGLAHGVRYAFPYLDRDVIAFAHRMPPEFLLCRGHKRAIMRAAAEDILPDDITFAANKAAPALAIMTKLARNKGALLAQARALRAQYGPEAYGTNLDAIIDAFETIPDEATAVAMDNAGEPARDPLIAMTRFDSVMALHMQAFDPEGRAGRP